MSVSPTRAAIKDELYAKMGDKTRTKLFGSLSVLQMANCNDVKRTESEVDGYKINPKLRFNFANKDFKISNG